MPSRPEHSLLANFVILFAALVCGTGVWLVVQFTETEEINLNVEVYPVGVDSTVDLELRNRDVLVRFSYPNVEAQRMKTENFFVEMDFSDLKESLARKIEDSGERPVYEEMVRSRFESEAYGITPVSVLKRQVKWEARLRWAMADVRPRIVGQPADGFTADEPLVEEGKREVRVLLQDWKQGELEREGVTRPVIETDPISINGRREMVMETVGLRFPAGIEPMPGEEGKLVTAVVEIRERTVQRRLSGIPVGYTFLSSGRGLNAEVRPGRIDVIVTAKKSVVERLSPADIRFSLFGVVEKAGETTEVPIEAVIADYDLRQMIEQVVTEPRTVSVIVTLDPALSPESPIPPPAPEEEDEFGPLSFDDGVSSPTAPLMIQTPVATPVPPPSDEAPSTTPN